MNILNLKKRYKIIFGIILCVVILLFAAPRFARRYIIKHSTEIIGRRLAIEKIRLNYFTGTLRVNNLQLFESDSKTVFLSFKRLIINLNYLPLFRNEIFVKNISLDEPYMQVLQDGDKFNFSTLMTTDSVTYKKDTIPEKPLKYIINDIRINRGYIKYIDQQLNNTIALNKLDLEIPGFTWNSDSTNLGVNLRFVDGGGLYSNLALNLADSTYSVNLKLDSLNLDIIEPYVKSNMFISALHGYLSNNIVIKGNMQNIMQLFVRGINHVYNFQLIDTLNRTILSFKDLTIDIDSLRLDKNRISFNYIGLTDPFILFEMIDTTNNWLALLKPVIKTPADSLQQQSGTTTTSAEGSYSFSKLQVSGGKVQLSDRTLRFPFDYAIDNLKIESSKISNMPGKLKLDIIAGLNGTGNFTADATVNPDDFSDLDISFSIKQFRMKDLDAYFKHYFGFPVTGGIMNFRTENKLRAESLESNNSIYFRKFTLSGSKLKESEYHVPLRLALGILSDKDGIIDIKAPVEMKGEDVRVRNLGKIIFRVIGDLFVKAAVSPVKMLSGLFKIDEAALQNIALGLSEPSPDEKNLKSVDIIADILNKKPTLNIDLFYCIDLKKTSDTLAYLMALEDYKSFGKSNGIDVNNVPDSTLAGYLLGKQSSATLKETSDLQQLCRNYIGTEKLNAKIDSLRVIQTGFMMNYLSHDKEISSNRFRIISIAPDTIKYEAAYPSFRTYFTPSGENPE
jgi:hypothetical protein